MTAAADSLDRGTRRCHRRPESPPLYAPSLVVASVTVLMVAIGVHEMGVGRPLVRLVSDGWARMLGPTVVAFVGVIVVLERVAPAVRRPLMARGHVQDLAYLVLYATAVIPLVVIIDLGFSHAIQRVAPWLVIPNLAVAPRAAVLVVAVLLMDGFNWLAHWANHKWVPLWRFHAVHHSQEELSILTSFRAHPLVHASFLIALIPVVMLSSTAVIPATVITAYICLSSLPHANLRWAFGPLGRVIVSPAYHRLHHAAEGRIDVNLGTVFTFWDVFTRRAVFPVPGARPILTGLDRRLVPVEQSRTTSGALGPLSILGVQLVEPFFTTRPATSGPPSWSGSADRRLAAAVHAATHPAAAEPRPLVGSELP